MNKIIISISNIIKIKQIKKNLIEKEIRLENLFSIPLSNQICLFRFVPLFSENIRLIESKRKIKITKKLQKIICWII